MLVDQAQPACAYGATPESADDRGPDMRIAENVAQDAAPSTCSPAPGATVTRLRDGTTILTTTTTPPPTSTTTGKRR